MKRMNVRWCCLLLLAAIPFSSLAQVLAPVIVSTNTTVRVMAANLTSGTNQRYEAPGLRIMQGLAPDVVAIQEFNYQSSTHGVNTTNAFREMINNTFGTNYVYFRETGYSIPNGIISRYPFIASGQWTDSDPNINDRGFAWARIDVPGTNDLYVVSVHLKASSGTDNVNRRTAQANEIKSLIQTHFPSNAWVIVAGDFNFQIRTEDAMNVFKTFLSDDRTPEDQAGNKNTNRNRDKPYDYVLPSFLLSSNHVPSVIGSASFQNGLVFDSRVYSPLSAVSPVQLEDSGVTNMQHMAVIKDFRIEYTMTNYVVVTSPSLRLISANTIQWSGQSNVSYRVESSTNLVNWATAGSISSPSTNYSFTFPAPSTQRSFYRVAYP